jgi:hypothetical protein
MRERISQVELMSSIFAGARRVLCWLGWEEGEEGRRHIQDAIRFMHSFMKDPEAGLSDARILLLHHDYLADPTEDLAHLSEGDRRRFEEQARKWEAIKFFFEIEYFHRTWIVQELGLARKAALLTALKPANDSDRIEQEAPIHQDVMIASEDSALKVDQVDWPLVGRFVEFLDYSGASLVTHIGLSSWVAHHILMVWATKPDGTPNCDFLTGMHWARILRVTDARDRVFGLLGHPMAVLDGELVVHADYTCTRGVVYTRLAVNFIRKTGSLYVVSLVDHEDDPSLKALDWDPQDDARMPSWVPDWHSINRTTPVDYAAAAAMAEDPNITIDGSSDGEAGSPLPCLMVRGWLVDQVSAVGHRMETTDFPITNLARELTKTNPFWLDRIWEVVFPSDAQSNISADHGDSALNILETLSLALPFGTREKGDPVGLAGLNQPLEDHHQSFAAYVLEYHELLHHASFELSDVNGKSGSLSELPARSLLDSLPPLAQSELRRRAEEAASGGFIECMTWPCMSRVVYRTAKGLVGMGSRITQPGDLICRVQGSTVLMTLRKVGDCDKGDEASLAMDSKEPITVSCVHIAPTVIPSRMKKGVIDGTEFGERAAQFRIL